MTKTKNAVAGLLTTLAFMAAVTGCASAVSPGDDSTGGPAAKASASSAPAHAQGKFTGVPTACLSADDVSLAVHQSLPHLAATTDSGSLDCNYYVDGGEDHPVVQLVYQTLPTTEAEWKSKSLAATGAVVVKGVGDYAFYVSTTHYNVMSFLSGTTLGNIITTPAVDEGHVITLAGSMLEG
jgi:hypothetical protein